MFKLTKRSVEGLAVEEKELLRLGSRHARFRPARLSIR